MCVLLGKMSCPREAEGPAKAEEQLAGVRASPGDPRRDPGGHFPFLLFLQRASSSRMLPRGRAGGVGIASGGVPVQG